MAAKTISKLQRLIVAATKAGARADLAKRRARIAKARLKLVRKAAKAAKKVAKQARKLVADAKAALIAVRLRRRARKKRSKAVRARAAAPSKHTVQRKRPLRTARVASPAAVARSVINRLDAAAEETAHSASPPAQGGGTSGP
jgi:hypothetical protein